MAKEQEPQSSEDWKTMAFSLVTNAIKQSSTNIIQTVHERIDKATHTIIKKFVIAFLILLGATLLLIGGAQYLGSLLGMVAYGYLIIGGIVLVAAALMQFASKE